MFKYTLLGVVICFQTMVVCTDFNSVVHENMDNPSKIVEELQKIRDRSEEADAFLFYFGGKNFREEGGSAKEYSLDVKGDIMAAAWNIGIKMFKRGEWELSDITSLLIARRFLRFASGLSDVADENDVTSEIDEDVTSLHCVDRDISPFCTLYMLEEMIKDRQRYISERQVAQKKMREKKEQMEKEGRVLDMNQFPQELLDELWSE